MVVGWFDRRRNFFFARMLSFAVSLLFSFLPRLTRVLAIKCQRQSSSTSNVTSLLVSSKG